MTVGKYEWHVYVLECEGGFWYVGISTFVESRFKKHCKGKGADFTRLHKPIRIVETSPLGTFDDAEANKLEKAKAREYATKYGHNKVAGGGYRCGGKGFLRDVLRLAVAPY